VSEDEFLAEFRAVFNWNGNTRITARQWAADHGFSPAYISDVLNGNRGVSDRIAEAMGYVRVVSFEKLT